VAEICRRLEGLPLAIELAAARTRLLDPPALLDRLAASLDALGTGAVDLPERQRTLRATVEWSVGLLEDAERSLLEVAAVFTDGWTIPAVAQVAGLDEDRALELCEALDRIRIPVVDALSRRTEGVIRVMRLRGPGGLVLPVDTGKSAFGLRTCAESAPNVVHMARISGPPGVQVVTQDPRYRHSAVLAIRHGKLGEPGSPAAVVGSKTCR